MTKNNWDKIEVSQNNIIEKQGYFDVTGPCKVKICTFLNVRTRTLIST